MAERVARSQEGAAAASAGSTEAAPPGAAGGQRRDATVFAVFRDLAADSSLRGVPLNVGARDSTLVLSGSVPDERTRDHVLEVARSHVGTFTLVDSLVIVDPAASPGGGSVALPRSAGADALAPSAGRAR